MAKLRVLVVALVACVTVGSVAVAVAKPSKVTKVKTKVSVTYDARP